MNSINRLERKLGMDLNGDGYIGGEGFLGRLERATHIDFNRDNIIGRRPDVRYGHPPICGPAPAFPHGMSYSYGYNSFYRY